MKFYTLTLTTAATAYSVLTLLRTQFPGFRDGVRYMIFQSPAGNGGYVRIGGADVSATVYGINLPAADASAAVPGYDFADVYALAQNDGDKLNVTVVY